MAGSGIKVNKQPLFVSSNLLRMSCFVIREYTNRDVEIQWFL
nr:MAG TPA: hypothetical protein [Caudoviricetes sp.]